ncbi:D-2-hydroxyacid dehydrogenase [Parahaliea mediterranea]|uniref:D-2-hydroxyacid dehydrogenase n=1 Tax=Parahaliea mediterranea TaxID=651086 RepID=A0A939ILH4_9GAMM|nr:D-2-hydroxyacid dehydrogenase [Parahaliea mediterranea]MBN7796500.1 D-2-hydroxyacid dehydrogenase [Parahaliea mediterranea]
MRVLNVLLTGIALALPGTIAAQVPSGAPLEVQRIIKDRGLDTAPRLLRQYPQWSPSKVVVALPRGFGSALPDYEKRLREVAGDVELVFDRGGDWYPDPALLEGADGLIGFCGEAVLSQAKDLFWLHSYTVGIDRCSSLDEALWRERVFSNSQRLSGPTIAEHSIAMLLSLARGLPAYHRAQMDGTWNRDIAGDEHFGELGGKTLLVVGLGGIGTEVARRAHGLGMRVIATRNSSREGPDFVDYVGLADELGKLSGEAHVIVNALPLTDATRGLFDADFFAGARPGHIFLSVGRGGSTVTDDLVAALRSGQVYGAGLDVTDPEPLPADHPLWRMKRVLITPHVAASGGDASRRAALIAVENLRRYVAGEALLSPVDMQKGY